MTVIELNIRKLMSPAGLLGKDNKSFVELRSILVSVVCWSDPLAAAL